VFACCCRRGCAGTMPFSYRLFVPWQATGRNTTAVKQAEREYPCGHYIACQWPGRAACYLACLGCFGSGLPRVRWEAELGRNGVSNI